MGVDYIRGKMGPGIFLCCGYFKCLSITTWIPLSRGQSTERVQESFSGVVDKCLFATWIRLSSGQINTLSWILQWDEFL